MAISKASSTFITISTPSSPIALISPRPCALSTGKSNGIARGAVAASLTTGLNCERFQVSSLRAFHSRHLRRGPGRQTPGDPPGGTGEFQRTEGGFEFSYQLVEFVRQAGGFSIGVAGFPEGHIACKEGKHVDWQRLKNKIDQGADFVITQLFFNNRDYFEFRDYLTKLGVGVPLVPGIVPVLSAAQIKKFTALCGADLPQTLLNELEKRGDDDEAVIEYGIEYATNQCRELLREGAPGIHFYTLNKARSTTAILKNLLL